MESKEKEFVLHHGKDGVTDVLTVEFDEFDDVFWGYLIADVTPEKVYLISFLDEEFVTSNLLIAIFYIKSILDAVDEAGGFKEDLEIALYLQEYDSFEDAYKVALMMNENEEICYSN